MMRQNLLPRKNGPGGYAWTARCLVLALLTPVLGERRVEQLLIGPRTRVPQFFYVLFWKVVSIPLFPLLLVVRSRLSRTASP